MKRNSKRDPTTEMIVAGVMSGTSADGVNVALVKFGAHTARLPFQLLGHAQFAYPQKVRHAVLSAMNASSASVADLARLNFLLGELYAEAVLKTQKQFKIKSDLIGCHGQTLFHQGEPQIFLGRKIATTWQTGEAAIIAAKVGAPVVSDFRPADMAAGGKGAPLVPFLDYILFRDPHAGRIVQNIGGIANLTAIPAAASPERLIAFDTGPGNMVIDAVMEKLFNRPFDRNGRIAASGKVLQKPLHFALGHKFLRKAPPKTAGREEFGREFVIDFLKVCGSAAKKEDIVATSTAFTAFSIAQALSRFVVGSKPTSTQFRDMIVSGGGTKNSTLMQMLSSAIAPLGVHLKFSDDLGLPSEAKEAAAFALLAHETWHRRPSNIPSATGAKRSAILGKISYP